MFKAIKEFFFGKPKEAVPEAPYKVETPAPVPVTEPVQQIPGVEAMLITPPVAEAPVKPARKPRANVAAKKIAAAKKPAARKPAAPKAPKAE
jgi:hypothetical protein